MHRLINDLQGDKELAIFWCSDVGDSLVVIVAWIITKFKPRLGKVWPVIIDDQEKALSAGFVHWVERKAKGFSDLDSAMKKVLFLCLSTFR